MKQKQILLLVGALVVLAGVAYLSGAFESEYSTVNAPTLAIPSDDIQQLTVRAKSDEVVLVKSNNRWALSAPISAKADSFTVARIVQSLGSLRLESIVSTSPDRYEKYGVDSLATMLTVTWPRGSKEIVVGDQGPDFQSVYVRVGDDPRVFLTTERLDVPDELERWRDKTITQIKAATLGGVQVSGPDRNYEAAYGSAGWTVTVDGSSVAADSLSVIRWLRRFESMKSNGFVDDVDPDLVRREHTHMVQFTSASGSTQTLYLQQRDDDLAVVNAEDPVTFKLASTRLDSYLPEASTLYKDDS